MLVLDAFDAVVKLTNGPIGTILIIPTRYACAIQADPRAAVRTLDTIFTALLLNAVHAVRAVLVLRALGSASVFFALERILTVVIPRTFQNTAVVLANLILGAIDVLGFYGTLQFTDVIAAYFVIDTVVILRAFE